MEVLVQIEKNNFGSTPDGQAVEKYTLKNKAGMQIDVITYGGIITSWTAPDKNGKYENIVLGFDNLKPYIKNPSYFGAIIGRYGNRIANGEFELDGKSFQLEKNDGTNCLHGGNKGFDKVIWSAKEKITDDSVSLILSYVSKDGEGGFPGTLTSTVTYTLNSNNTLEVEYKATTDKKTIVNLTQHSYFNLSGDFSKNILNNVLSIDADKIISVDIILIPTGKFKSVENTPFDFRTPKEVGKDIDKKDEQLLLGNGYDHCWILNHQNTFRKIASVLHPASGRYMEVFSNEPGVQFYSGNFLDDTLIRPDGGTYAKRTGLCLETQHYPDSPNQKSFPSVVLKPGEKYYSKTAFKFSIR